MSEFEMVVGFRIFWSAFLGIILVIGYWNSYRIENGMADSWYYGKNNSKIWFDPVVFTIIVPAYFIMYLGIYGYRDGKLLLTGFLLDLIVFISIYFSFILILLKALRTVFTAKTCAALWLLPVFLFYNPQIFNFSCQLPPFCIVYIPERILLILFYIWLAGFLIIFSKQCISHLRFVRKLKLCSRQIGHERILKIWEEIKKEIGITFSVELRYCSIIRTPLSIGMRQKKLITFLPEMVYTDEEARMIFAHELRHLQRMDTHTKFFLKFCNAMGWFHPLVWMAVKKAEEDLELSCDEIVLKDADREQRKQYARLLLLTAGESRGYTTCLSSSAEAMKYRLRATVIRKKRKKGLPLLFILLFLSGMIIGRIAYSTERGTIGVLTQEEVGKLKWAESGTGDGTGFEITKLDQLSEYLSGIQVEKISYDYMEQGNEPHLYAENENGRGYYISDQYLDVYNKSGSRIVYYHVKNPVDWEYINALQ